jgi:hypothetical protein
MTLSVELQPRDAGWIQLGTQQDGGHGVMPGSIEYTGDLSEYGCLDASFRLKLNPRWPRHIIEQFTPVVIKDGSNDVWSGRIIAAPSTYAQDAEVLVQCQGWGQHTKDDCTPREWVIRDMSRWQDGSPSVSTTNRARVSQSGSITNAAGGLTLAWAQGSVLVINTGLCITLDMGPNGTAKRVVAPGWLSNGMTSASMTFMSFASSSPDVHDTSDRQAGWSVGTPGAGPTNTAATFTTAKRYVHILLYWTGATVTLAANAELRMPALIVFTDAADESGDASILKASTVISETLDAICPLISPSRAKLVATATSLPNFPGGPGWRYGNELIDKANEIHGYGFRLTPDPLPVPEYFPLPTDYSFVVGAGEYTLGEPGAQDGRNVYSRVISEYEDANGVKADAVALDATRLPSSVQVANPSFDTDTSGWTIAFGTGVRDTAVFDTAPASLRLTTDGAGLLYWYYGASPALSGLTPGKRYRYTFRWRRAAAFVGLSFYVQDAVTAATLGEFPGTTTAAAASAAMMASTIGAWVDVSLEFVAPAGGRVNIITSASGPASTVMAYFDSVTIFEYGGSVVNRRGFTRTALRPPGMRTTTATAGPLAQLELDNAQFPPFKGTLMIGPRVRTKGGGSMSASVLPSRVGDALLIENMEDPNTRALGRQGIIYRAKYNETTGLAEVEIDATTSFLQQLKARIAAGVR